MSLGTGLVIAALIVTSPIVFTAVFALYILRAIGAEHRKILQKRDAK